MEKISKSNSGQGFGTAGLVFGILSLIIVFIPDINIHIFIAILFGLIGVSLSALALSQANKNDGKLFLIRVALIICIVSIIVSILRGVYIGADNIEDSIEYLEKEMMRLKKQLKSRLRKLLKEWMIWKKFLKN